METEQSQVLVIGAGVGGISTLLSVARAGFTVVCLEAEEEVRCPSVDSGASALLTDFPDFTHAQAKAQHPGLPYLRAYCKHHRLTNHIRFQCKVESLRRTDEGLWLASYVHNGRLLQLQVGFVVIATGGSTPYIPVVPGQALFKGLQVHSRNLQDPSLIQGQAVVIVGEGQQAAAEYAAKLSVTAGFKQLVLVQTKKAQWQLPENVGSYRAEDIVLNRCTSFLLPPFYSASPVSRVMHALAAPFKAAVWACAKSSIKHDLNLTGNSIPSTPLPQGLFTGEAHFANPTLPLLLQHGRVKVVNTGISCFKEGSLLLNDGTSIKADVVVYATGMAAAHHFLEAGVRERLRVSSDGIYLYRHMVHPDIPNLAFVGSEAITYSPALTATLQSEWLVQLLTGDLYLPSAKDMHSDIAKQEQWKLKHMPSHRNRAATLQLYGQAYHDQLMKDMGMRMRRKGPGSGLFAECCGAYRPADYAHLVQPVDSMYDENAATGIKVSDAACPAPLGAHPSTMGLALLGGDSNDDACLDQRDVALVATHQATHDEELLMAQAAGLLANGSSRNYSEAQNQDIQMTLSMTGNHQLHDQLDQSAHQPRQQQHTLSSDAMQETLHSAGMMSQPYCQSPSSLHSPMVHHGILAAYCSEDPGVGFSTEASLVCAMGSVATNNSNRFASCEMRSGPQAEGSLAMRMLRSQASLGSINTGARSPSSAQPSLGVTSPISPPMQMPLKGHLVTSCPSNEPPKAGATRIMLDSVDIPLSGVPSPKVAPRRAVSSVEPNHAMDGDGDHDHADDNDDCISVSDMSDVGDGHEGPEGSHPSVRSSRASTNAPRLQSRPMSGVSGTLSVSRPGSTGPRSMSAVSTLLQRMRKPESHPNSPLNRVVPLSSKGSVSSQVKVSESGDVGSSSSTQQSTGGPGSSTATHRRLSIVQRASSRHAKSFSMGNIKQLDQQQVTASREKAGSERGGDSQPSTPRHTHTHEDFLVSQHLQQGITAGGAVPMLGKQSHSQSMNGRPACYSTRSTRRTRITATDTSEAAGSWMYGSYQDMSMSVSMNGYSRRYSSMLTANSSQPRPASGSYQTNSTAGINSLIFNQGSESGNPLSAAGPACSAPQHISQHHNQQNVMLQQQHQQPGSEHASGAVTSYGSFDGMAPSRRLRSYVSESGGRSNLGPNPRQALRTNSSTHLFVNSLTAITSSGQQVSIMGSAVQMLGGMPQGPAPRSQRSMTHQQLQLCRPSTSLHNPGIIPSEASMLIQDMAAMDGHPRSTTDGGSFVAQVPGNSGGNSFLVPYAGAAQISCGQVWSPSIAQINGRATSGGQAMLQQDPLTSLLESDLCGQGIQAAAAGAGASTTPRPSGAQSHRTLSSACINSASRRQMSSIDLLRTPSPGLAVSSSSFSASGHVTKDVASTHGGAVTDSGCGPRSMSQIASQPNSHPRCLMQSRSQGNLNRSLAPPPHEDDIVGALPAAALYNSAHESNAQIASILSLKNALVSEHSPEHSGNSVLSSSAHGTASSGGRNQQAAMSAAAAAAGGGGGPLSARGSGMSMSAAGMSMSMSLGMSMASQPGNIPSFGMGMSNQMTGTGSMHFMPLSTLEIMADNSSGVEDKGRKSVSSAGLLDNPLSIGGAIRGMGRRRSVKRHPSMQNLHGTPGRIMARMQAANLDRIVADAAELIRQGRRHNTSVPSTLNGGFITEDGYSAGTNAGDMNSMTGSGSVFMINPPSSVGHMATGPLHHAHSASSTALSQDLTFGQRPSVHLGNIGSPSSQYGMAGNGCNVDLTSSVNSNASPSTSTNHITSPQQHGGSSGPVISNSQLAHVQQMHSSGMLRTMSQGRLPARPTLTDVLDGPGSQSSKSHMPTRALASGEFLHYPQYQHRHQQPQSLTSGGGASRITRSATETVQLASSQQASLLQNLGSPLLPPKSDLDLLQPSAAASPLYGGKSSSLKHSSTASANSMAGSQPLALHGSFKRLNGISHNGVAPAIDPALLASGASANTRPGSTSGSPATSMPVPILPAAAGSFRNMQLYAASAFSPGSGGGTGASILNGAEEQVYLRMGSGISEKEAPLTDARLMPAMALLRTTSAGKEALTLQQQAGQQATMPPAAAGSPRSSLVLSPATAAQAPAIVLAMASGLELMAGNKATVAMAPGDMLAVEGAAVPLSGVYSAVPPTNLESIPE